MMETYDDKESNLANLYIDKSNIDLNNIKESNELFDSSEELVLKIIYRPIFVTPGNFYYGFTMLYSEAESYDENFNFEVGKVYTI